MNKTKVSSLEALTKLEQSEREFIEVYKHGSMVLEIYKPNLIDKQTPHSRDEIYIIISGRGKFICGDEKIEFREGDFLFAPAMIEHKFEDFSDDLATWVIFYGPEGGEKD